MLHLTTSSRKLSLLIVGTVLLTGCKKQSEPVQPAIPICHSEPGTSGSTPIDWKVLPAIPATPPIFSEAEKIRKTNFNTGVYTNDIGTKQYPYIIVADASDNLRFPTDLAVNPIRPNELWVSNYGESFRPGQYTNQSFTSTVFNPGESSQFSVRRKDKAIFSRHFFSYPTGLAFDKDGYWANTSYFNNNGTNGPTLWTSDFAIYADSVKYITNGSHSSMLHESFTTLGIAADENNTFWVLDGTTGEVVSYNFGKGHYPGGDDHTDGIIRRYALIDKVTPIAGMPSHLCYDPATKWLYIVDSSKQRILRLKTDSGTLSGTKKGIDNPKEYSTMAAQSEIFLADLSLKMPSGIDTDGTHLYVSDYETGRITLYELATKKMVNSIETKAKGIAGILVDKKAQLWYVNHLKNELVRITM